MASLTRHSINDKPISLGAASSPCPQITMLCLLKSVKLEAVKIFFSTLKFEEEREGSEVIGGTIMPFLFRIRGRVEVQSECRDKDSVLSRALLIGAYYYSTINRGHVNRALLIRALLIGPY